MQGWVFQSAKLALDFALDEKTDFFPSPSHLLQHSAYTLYSLWWQTKAQGQKHFDTWLIYFILLKYM